MTNAGPIEGADNSFVLEYQFLARHRNANARTVDSSLRINDGQLQFSPITEYLYAAEHSAQQESTDPAEQHSEQSLPSDSGNQQNPADDDWASIEKHLVNFLNVAYGSSCGEDIGNKIECLVQSLFPDSTPSEQQAVMAWFVQDAIKSGKNPGGADGISRAVLDLIMISAGKSPGADSADTESGDDSASSGSGADSGGSDSSADDSEASDVADESSNQESIDTNEDDSQA